LKHNRARKIYSVTVTAGGQGEIGYVADWLIWRNLPDPDAEVVKIKSGETPLQIARDHYASKGFNVWGKDSRYVVNALAWVSAHAKHNAPGKEGIHKGDVGDDWDSTTAIAGVYVWLPGPDYLNAIYEEVAKHGGGTGSITADLWRKVKKVYHYVAYG